MDPPLSLTHTHTQSPFPPSLFQSSYLLASGLTYSRYEVLSRRAKKKKRRRKFGDATAARRMLQATETKVNK